MKFTAAVIGLGRIGLGYDLTSAPEEVLSHSKAFLRHTGFELVGGADPDPACCAAFEAFTGRPAYATPGEMLERHRPQVVVIAAPTSEHLAMTELAIGFGPAAILCEKPLASTYADGKRMADLCQAHGVLLGVNYMRRFDPALQTLGSRIKNGDFGDVFKGTLWYSKGLLHNGSHYLDLLSDWLGPVTSFDILDPGPRNTMAGPEPDVLFRFEAGCQLYALAAREECYSLIDLDLVGTKGRLRYANLGATVECWGTQEDPMFPGYTILDRIAEVAQPDLPRYQWHVAEGLHKALSMKTPLASNHENGLAVLSLCELVADRIRLS